MFRVNISIFGSLIQNVFSGCDNINNINHNPKPAPSKMHKRRDQTLHASKQHAADGSLHSFIHDVPRHWRLEIQRLRLRHGPVRRVGQGREEADAEILQLVRVLHKLGDTNCSDGSRVHSGSYREVLGLRDKCVCYAGGSSGVVVGHQEVPLQETGGKSLGADRDGVCGGLEEEALGISL